MPANKTGLTIVVCSYNMDRELPRTLETLTPPFQKGIEDVNLEIIVLDNGSKSLPDLETPTASLCDLRILSPEKKHVSPAHAINWAMSQAKHSLLGLWIDGARMASPRVIQSAIQAWKINPNKVIGTLGFHLGPDVQMKSVKKGYNQKIEDELLDFAQWRRDGYNLFNISALAASSSGGYFLPISESNGVFMTKDFWEEINGLDERFESAGGGYVNLDFWRRAVSQSNNAPWMILGEGTFHQYHGGAATGGDSTARLKMSEEYKKITGQDFKRMRYTPCFVGEINNASATTLLSKRQIVRLILNRYYLVFKTTRIAKRFSWKNH